MSNICSRCGTMVPEGAQFCPSCGNPQVQQPVQQAAPSPVQPSQAVPAMQQPAQPGQQQNTQQQAVPPPVQLQPIPPVTQQPQQPVPPATQQPPQPPSPSYGQPPQGYGQPPQGYFQSPVKKDNKKTLIIIAVILGLLYLYGSNNQQQQPAQQPGTQQPGTQQPVSQPGANTQAIIQELSDSELGLQQIRQIIQGGNTAKALQVIPQLAQGIAQVVQQIPEDQAAINLFQLQLQRCQLLQNAAQGNRNALQQEMQVAAQFQQGFNAYCNGR